MTDPALQIPEVIQTASINPEPSAEHDVNPPTAASEKQPVVEDDVASEAGSIPSDVVAPHRMIKPVSRRHQLPPLPDLRFEQSYLASLRGADTWGRVAWITIRDQVLLPLIQGTVWTLALSGWRFWNRNASLSGQTLGSKIRRWWYEVNNWKLPPLRSAKDPRIAAKVEDTLTFAEFLQFYTAQFSNAGAD
ncbi:DUF1770 domain-containing protein [Aspergillus tubingensis]|uniref:DUF1770 domain-containing protein n=3 Tax=Aspergillus subgen. Circumdati TaxID=2720871 RepID=A0A1L9N4Z1_ASPTC|nr:DUF1770-domain-containing protein [Aspergillus costaricaensis CBS 115574]XP_035361223.1 DUF1770-domain-containing protein [Aspergillus tubingensis]OJI84403.1 hypothetical protein ASPTUDRAFT_663729 [Aspergillus tubingensis CBS 134.48]GAQ45408.1 similar to An17g01340 [Aspergillus niger]RAK83653.1 DUF1770-domain-containing protein [Aspergillus costaricaensis CBS 115574]GFN20419.1 DUF1770-domain-containing protein [Aspergillus tubingensis]